ncbi:MAG: CrcB family protein [bacterium]
MMPKLFWLALAGAAGTLARYGLVGIVQRGFGQSFPWGTLAVNIIGCLLAGLVWTLAEERNIISGEMRLIVLIGFMGAFTTFSSLILETTGLMKDTEWLRAMGNLTLHNGIGLMAFYVGMITGRIF